MKTFRPRDPKRHPTMEEYLEGMKEYLRWIKEEETDEQRTAALIRIGILEEDGITVTKRHRWE
jgi:hypothetical protein